MLIISLPLCNIPKLFIPLFVISLCLVNLVPGRPARPVISCSKPVRPVIKCSKPVHPFISYSKPVPPIISCSKPVCPVDVSKPVCNS